jgi:hypothetical protein
VEAKWSELRKKVKLACVKWRSNVEVARGVDKSVVRVGSFYARLVVRRMSKIAFRKMVWSSFKWLLLLILFMWNLSIVFKLGPFCGLTDTARSSYVV